MSRIIDRNRAPRVLLVEDCEGDILLFRKAFVRLFPEAELTIERSAEIALAKLERNLDTGDDAFPDLILTDLNLPGASGVDLLRQVKASDRLRRTPCLVLTSSASAGDIEMAYDAHANGYLVKPLSMEELTEMIATIGALWFTFMQLPVDVTERPYLSGRASG